MSRRDRTHAGRAQRVAELLGAGDHRAAAGLARAILADPDAAEAERAGARSALASLRPEPGAVGAGAAALALAAATTIWTLLHG